MWTRSEFFVPETRHIGQWLISFLKPPILQVSGTRIFYCRVALDTKKIIWTPSKFFVPETRHKGQELVSVGFIIEVTYVTGLGYKDLEIKKNNWDLIKILRTRDPSHRVRAYFIIEASYVTGLGYKDFFIVEWL